MINQKQPVVFIPNHSTSLMPFCVIETLFSLKTFQTKLAKTVFNLKFCWISKFLKATVHWPSKHFRTITIEENISHMTLNIGLATSPTGEILRQFQTSISISPSYLVRTRLDSEGRVNWWCNESEAGGRRGGNCSLASVWINHASKKLFKTMTFNWVHGILCLHFIIYLLGIKSESHCWWQH